MDLRTEGTAPNAATDLPDHVLFDLVQSYLGGCLNSFGRLSQVCKKYESSLSNAMFWELKLRYRFQEAFIHPSYRKKSLPHPKDVYQATHLLEKRFVKGDFVLKLNFRGRNTVITSMRIHEKNLIVGDSAGALKILRLDTDVQRPPDIEDTHGPSLSVLSQSLSGVTCLGSSRSHVISGHMDGTCLVHDVASSSRFILPIHDGSRISSLSSVTASHILTCSTANRSICLYDVTRGENVISKRTSPDSLPNCVSVASHTAFIGHRDRSVRVLDLRSGEFVSTFRMNDWCLCVEADPSDQFLLRASDRAVKTFDFRSPLSPVDTRHANKRLISQFKSDSKFRLVSCGLDGQVVVSSLESPTTTPTPIHTSDDYVLCVDFDRTRLACGSINGKFNLFNF